MFITLTPGGGDMRHATTAGTAAAASKTAAAAKAATAARVQRCAAESQTALPAATTAARGTGCKGILNNLCLK